MWRFWILMAAVLVTVLALQSAAHSRTAAQVPSQVSSPTPPPPPSSTATPIPSIQITSASLFRSISGSIHGTCSSVLAGGARLQSTTLLYPNQTGIFRIGYRTLNAGSKTPAGHVIYESASKVVDGNLLRAAKGSTGTFFCTGASFSKSGIHHYTANFTLVLGPAAAATTLPFTVARCAHGTTGANGQCVRCSKGYTLKRGACRKTSKRRG
jgi:hypothetical protein